MRLAQAMASQVLAYDPDILILGGGLSDIDEIVQALPAAISRHLFSGAKVPAIRRAEFGAASGERGAAILASRQTASGCRLSSLALTRFGQYLHRLQHQFRLLQHQQMLRLAGGDVLAARDGSDLTMPGGTLLLELQ